VERLLEEKFEALEEPRSDRTIGDPVVRGQRHPHPVGHLDLATYHDRPGDNRPHGQDGRFGRIDDRDEIIHIKHPQVADREGAGGQVLLPHPPSPGALDQLDRVATRHPGLKLVIDHVGLDIRAKAPKVWEDLPKVCALAKHPNVAVKASGMPSLSNESYPFRDLHPHIRTLVEAFGPRRTFWGTDLTRMPCSYRECIDLFTKELPWLKGQDLESVMGRGVCEWLGWPL